VYVFGFRALAITLVSVAACVFFEWGYRKIMKRPDSVGDLSAVVTGMLLAFCIPANVPYWLPVIGAFFAIVIVKQLYGGIGKNFVNPALAARAFLFSWPVIMTTWMTPGSYGSIFNFGADAVTSATPMASLHQCILPDIGLTSMFLGNIGGSLGEVSALALILGGIYLVARKVISCRIPLIYILTVAVITFIFPKGGNGNLEWMLYNLLGGGLMLGAIFMATDYSTSPITVKGQIIYALGCGLITVFIRYFGAYPEGVSYAILVMNVCVWLIDKYTLPRRFGVSKEDIKAAKAKAKEEKKKAKEGVA
jgi:electron transport complex protein RnfD